MEIRWLDYILSFIMAFIIAFFFTPTAKKVAIKLGAVDVPSDNRRVHKKPMARMGGLAIVVAFLGALIYNILADILLRYDSPALGEFSFVQYIGLFIGGLIIFIMGILDDITPLSAKVKFTVQILAAFTVALTGTRIDRITNPFAETGVTIQLWLPFAVFLTVFWIVGITNAINLLDGLDGLAAGVSAIASLSLFFIAVIQGMFGVAILTVILAGSTLGFLPHNMNPAKIFMGETGSAFLGFILGVISVIGPIKGYTAIAIGIPLIILGLPIFDTVLAVIRRIIKRRPIGQGDKGHIHHKLLSMGLSHKQSVWVLYVVSGTLGLVAILLSDKQVLPLAILVIFISVCVIGGVRYFSEIHEIEKSDDSPQNKIDTKTVIEDDTL